MKLTIITTFVYLLLTSFLTVLAIPIDLESRDVYVPPVLYPRQGTVWLVGEHHNIVWWANLFDYIDNTFNADTISLSFRDTSNPPVNITNKIGQILLRKADLTTPGQF